MWKVLERMTLAFELLILKLMQEPEQYWQVLTTKYLWQWVFLRVIMSIWEINKITCAISSIISTFQNIILRASFPDPTINLYIYNVFFWSHDRLVLIYYITNLVFCIQQTMKFQPSKRRLRLLRYFTSM